ncbi:peptide-N-glycosidase F-related protein [Chitinophaga nivalis]|uniref:Peptide-N-glycosidase F-related protein n=1 Tax=Chitinophaga nivalis TaxID=2991709 RepID=A0ABT3IP83_9BACT|nr:peptide-N-glycosidase F-related protein [Chitinophaga nivalis]MCW3464527.1 peptide-N-glycosidase F-related protein [Chitinophaga nivalis]MCW3485782.1 peptide-N-glycosidase F-related protein [Chitinophaga nivalis]
MKSIRLFSWLAVGLFLTGCTQKGMESLRPDTGAVAATTKQLTGTYEETVFSRLDFYNGYANAQFTDGNGVIYLNNTVAIKKISLKGKADATATLKGQLRIYQQGDGYDRDGQVFFLRDSVVKAILNNQVTFDDAAKAKIDAYAPKTGYLYVTPFFYWYQSIKSVPYTFDLKDVAALLTGNDSCWVGVSAWGTHLDQSDWVGKNEPRSFSADFSITADNGTVNNNPTYVQAVQFGRIADAAGNNIRTLNKTITVPRRLKNAKIVVISQAWGAGSGGEEYTYRTHQVSWDNTQVGTFSSKVACGPNTMRSYDISSSPRNWCPSEVVPSHAFSISGNIEAGTTHTVTVDILNAKADANNNFKLSVYITGELF